MGNTYGEKAFGPKMEDPLLLVAITKFICLELGRRFEDTVEGSLSNREKAGVALRLAAGA